MSSRVRAAAACAVAAMLAACGGGSSSNDPGPTGPALGLSATSVTIPATQAGGPLPAAQTVYITNAGSGTLATPTATPADAWLDATVVTSGAGYRLSLRPNTTALAPATRNTTVQVASAGATSSPRTVTVSWQVTAAAAPVLVAAPAALTFTAQVGDADPASQPIHLYNGGTGSLGVLGAAADAAWLTPSLVGTTVTVSVALGALDGGDYTGHVSVTAGGASNSPVSVPVTFHVLEPTISVSTATMGFTASLGANPPNQTRTITNTGTGTFGAVTASASYTTGSGWLSPSVTGTGNTRTLTVAVTTPGGAGTYDGKVTVASANTTNGSVDIPVHLVVTAVAAPELHASPTSLSFTMTAGTNPASQPIAVTNSGGGTLAAIGATPSYTTGTGWMSATVTGSGNSQTVTVSIAGSPAAGSYSGSLSLASSGASNTPVSIPVTLQVNPAGGGGGDTSTPAGGFTALYDARIARSADCFKAPAWWVQQMEAGVAAGAAGAADAVTAGRLSYDRAQLDACVAWMAGASCWALYNDVLDPSCNLAFTGLVSNGAQCSESSVCANGWCAFQNTCPGTCTAFLADGDPCAADEECGPEKVCAWNETAGALECAARSAPGGNGQPCSNGSPLCQEGFYCGGASEPTCTPQLSAGAPCQQVGSMDECAGGLFCVPSSQGGFRCTALVGEGQSCTSGWCGLALYCSPSQGDTCRVLPTAGQSCAEVPPQDRCADGTYCFNDTCTNGTLGVGAQCSPAPTSASQACAVPPLSADHEILCLESGPGTFVCTSTASSCQ